LGSAPQPSFLFWGRQKTVFREDGPTEFWIRIGFLGVCDARVSVRHGVSLRHLLTR
jgi:hypothetical protein